MRDKRFQKIEEGIYRLCVPFYNIYTTVFLLVHKKHCILVDCASNESDVEKYIMPALQQMNVIPTEIICSHMHEDHSGGLEALAKKFSESTVGMFAEIPDYIDNPKHQLVDNDVIGDRFKILNLKGHCKDSLGIFDLETKTLLTFDSLQMYGVSYWGTGVSNYMDYKATLCRVKELSPKRIITAHDYVPYGYQACGEDEIQRYLTACEEAIDFVKEYAAVHQELDSEETAQLYRKEYPKLPPIAGYVVECVRKVSAVNLFADK